MLALHLGLIAVSMAVVWWAGGMLEGAAERLARRHRVPPLVEGTLIAAVGSSLPELATVVVATLLHGEFELGVSAIVGSAIFNLLVIPGLAAALSGRLEANRVLLRQELPFYALAVVVTGVVFVAAYTLEPVPGKGMRGEYTRAMALVPLALYAAYLWLQHRGMRRYRRSSQGVASDPQSSQGDWGRLVLSLVLIVASVEGLVRGVLYLGEFFDTPSFLWGATLVAAATSAPDAVVSIRQARDGRGVTSLGNVLGSNVFDLLVAVPLGVLLAGSTVVALGIAGPLVLALLVSTIVVAALLLRGRGLSRFDAGCLLLVYVGFVVWLFVWRGARVLY